MQQTFKIGETLIIVKGVKAEIEKITGEIKRLLEIRNYYIQKNGILGGEERETIFMALFSQNELRDAEGYEAKKAEFLKYLSSKIITLADYPAIRIKVNEIFDAHVHIEDNRQTEEQKQQKTIEHNRIAKEREAKREEERIKTEQEKEQLKKDYPYLSLVNGSGLSPRIMATKNIRTELSRAFPGIKFSVKSESYSGGDSIDIDWTDEVTKDEVEKITKKYQEGYFNGMNDIYEYNNAAFNSLFGGAKYVFAQRKRL